MMSEAKKPPAAAAPVEVEVEVKPASAEDVMKADHDDVTEQLNEMAGPPPTPTEPIPVSRVRMLLSAINDAMQFLSDGKAPKLKTDIDQAAGATQAAIDKEPWVILNALAGLVEMMKSTSPDVAGAYTFDPKAIVTMGGVSDVAGILQRLSRDSAFKEAVLAMEKAHAEKQTEASPEPGSAPPAPGPDMNGGM